MIRRPADPEAPERAAQPPREQARRNQARTGHHPCAELLVPLTLGALLSACVEIEAFDVALPSIPDEIEWGAILAEGPPATGSALVRRESGRFMMPLSNAAPAGRAWFVGYRSESVAALEVSAGVEIRDLRVRPALADDPILERPPDWVAAGAWSGEGLALAESMERPEVTGNWLAPCPRIVPQEGARIATTCLAFPCAALVRQQECRLEVSIEGCGIPGIDGRIGPRGQLLLDAGAPFGECAPVSPTRPEFLASASCRFASGFECEAHLVATATPTLSVRRTKIYDVVMPEVGLSFDRRGYVLDLATVDLSAGPRVVVAGHHGELQNLFCTSAPGELVVLDSETLVVTSSVSGFGCLVNLAADPSDRQAVYATTVRGGVQRVLRIDLETGEQRSSPSTVPALPFMPAQSLRVDDQGRVLVAYAPRISDERGYLYVFDRDTLAVTAIIDGISNRALDAAFDRAGNIVVADDLGRVTTYAPSGAPIAYRDLESDCGQTSLIVAAAWDFSLDGTAFMSARHNRNGFAVFGLALHGARCRLATFFEWPAAPSGLVEWPSDPRFLLVGVDSIGEEPGTLRSAVALLDKTSLVFRPGAVTLGTTVVSRLAGDRHGRAFALLPYEAAVARIDPAR